MAEVRTDIRTRILAEASPEPPAAPEQADHDDLGEEHRLVVGAKAVGDLIGLSARQVRHVVEKGTMPIWHEEGIGIVSTRAALRSYIRERARAAARRAS